jgi:Zn-dependent protease with chaperone function
LRGPIVAAFTTQQLISLRASQRAEYLADVIGARTSSPASMAGALDAIVTGRDTFKTVIEQRKGRKSHPVSGDSNPDFGMGFVRAWPLFLRASWSVAGGSPAMRC